MDCAGGHACRYVITWGFPHSIVGTNRGTGEPWEMRLKPNSGDTVIAFLREFMLTCSGFRLAGRGLCPSGVTRPLIVSRKPTF